MNQGNQIETMATKENRNQVHLHINREVEERTTTGEKERLAGIKNLLKGFFDNKIRFSMI